ncbi:MAG: hypothetical protein HC842_09705 [Cytophagales bacterium]|nr:hypothetical protein [Cytophagales bacterium]
MRVEAHLVDSYVDSRDLALFAPELAAYDDQYYFNGSFNGYVNDFALDNFRLHFGQRSFVYGDFRLIGLPEFFETFIDARIEHSNLSARDLSQYVGQEHYQHISAVENMGYEGHFIGFPLDFVTNGVFRTPFGQVSSDINLKLPYKDTISSYSGRLQTTEFDLGGLLGDTLLYQRVSAQGMIQGYGFTTQTADFVLQAEVSSLGILGYDYQNITTDGRFTSRLFDGQLSINDPNLQVVTTGLIDTQTGKDSIRLHIELIKADLRELGFYDQRALISSTIKINLKGVELDTIEGYTDIVKTNALIGPNALYVDSVRMVSKSATTNVSSTFIPTCWSSTFLGILITLNWCSAPCA